MRAGLLVPLLAPGLGGCGSMVGTAWRLDDGGPDGLGPSVEILSPAAGAVYPVGETLRAEAVLSHPSEAPDALVVELRSGDEALTGWSVSPEGAWTWEIAVEGGRHEAELRVVDADGDSASATLSWSGNRPPELAIQRPLEGAVLTAGEPVRTEATLTDADVSDPRLLDARWEVDGETVATGAPDSGGVLELSLPGLAEGAHTLVLVGSDGVVEVSAEVGVTVELPLDTGDPGDTGSAGDTGSSGGSGDTASP